QRDDVGLRNELVREVENVADRGGPKRIDGLGIVTDNRQPAARRLESQKNRRLESVGVLVLVDQYMVEASSDLFGDRAFRHHVRPIEKQVVVVEHVLALLRLDVS